MLQCEELLITSRIKLRESEEDFTMDRSCSKFQESESVVSFTASRRPHRMERDSTGLSDWRPVCICWRLRISITLYQLRLHCRGGKQFWSESHYFKHLCKLHFGSSDYLFLYSALFAVSPFLPLWPANCELEDVIMYSVLGAVDEYGGMVELYLIVIQQLRI